MTDEDDLYTDGQKYWLKEIERAEKYFDKWWKRADKLVNLYRRQNTENVTKRRFSMLWANTEVLKPAVYARQPVPQVSRRYRDKDPVGRVAAELLERASTFECERMNIDDVFRNVRDDLLLPGRGVAWVRFNAEIDDATQEVKEQKCIVDYINWRQFLHGPAPIWELVPWVCKVVPMGDKEGEGRFGRDKWKLTKSDKAKDQANDERNPNKGQDKTDVYEIWCKATGKVHYVAKGAKDILEEGPPPLNFDEFFPCPKPVYATTTTDSTVPIPDYVYYQDQAEEIDDLTARISSLTDSLKLVGFYPAGGPEDVSTAIQKALNPSVENTMIPVSSWAAFAEKGGSGGIVYLPIKEVAEVIVACVELRKTLIQDVYQIAGISDIQRGASDPDETARAQEIKNQWGSVRVRDRQQELARFARDIIRLCCEIIAENFDPMRVMQMANMVPPPQPDPAMEQFQQAVQAHEAEIQKMEAAFQLLKDERLRGFRIEIETDSTIQPDENAEKQRRTEFVTAIGTLLQQAIPAVQQVPEMAPLIGEMLTFTVRGFRAGRTLEDQIEQTMQSIQQRISQMQANPQPDPAVAKAQVDGEIKQKQFEQDKDLAQQRFEHEKTMDQQRFDNEKELSQEDLALRQQTASVDQGIKFQGKKGVKFDNSEVLEALLSLGKIIVDGQQQMAMMMQSGDQQIVRILTSPKTVKTPDGRVYTAQYTPQTEMVN